MPNDLPSVDTTSTYALIASLVVFTLWLGRKASPATWAKIPPRWRWVVPVLVAGGMAFAEAQQSGRPWKHALIGALCAGLTASGGHHMLSDVPFIPYGNAALLLVVLSLGTTACATAKPYIVAVNQAASLLCESSPDAQRAAKLRGISVADLCALHEVIEPFVDEAMRAQSRAQGRAARAMVRP